METNSNSDPDDDAMARRLNNDDSHDDEVRHGLAAGELWARQHATRMQLLRAARWVEEDAPDFARGLTNANRFSHSGLALSRVEPEFEGDSGAQAEFWLKFANEPRPPFEFYRAFFEAAAKAYNRVCSRA